MADPADIIARARARGANIVLADGKLRIVNGNRLPSDAGHYIMQHRDAIIAHLQDAVDEIEERAAIVEHDGGASPEAAMQFARQIARAKEWPDAAARVAYLDACGMIVDQAFGRAAA